MKKLRKRTEHDDIAIIACQRNNLWGIREHPEKRFDGNQTEKDKENRMRKRQKKAVRYRRIRGIPVSRAQLSRNIGIDAHARADRHRKNQILQGKGERYGGQGILAETRDEHAVDDIVH